MTIEPCAHCGRLCGDVDGGWAAVEGKQVCHPNVPDRTDCYVRITVYGERLGSRMAESGAFYVATRPHHRPVILVAPDWPDMLALKEHAASLGADVEVSDLPASKSCRVVWVPKNLNGNVSGAVYEQAIADMRGPLASAAHGLVAFHAAMTGVTGDGHVESDCICVELAAEYDDERSER